MLAVVAFAVFLGLAVLGAGWLGPSWAEAAASTTEPGAGGPANRLAGESSPYLRLHAHNPVDWYPWGDEALDKARREHKPIFLSVGYSTCYWCHVMERESFSNPEIAAFLNEHFVAIKVDREERPDLDEIYMLATQLMTRRGGWPNSVFLTPDLEPFYAGTYFPPDDRQGQPGFASLLRAIERSWSEEPERVEAHAGQLASAMRRVLEQRADGSAAEAPGREAAEAAFASLESRFDAELGGFGEAPKFPTPSNLFLLLELDRAAADRMLRLTLDHMARGGIYDQVGGGFHRYSTDARWLVPHFEKMLYDNGSLLELYGLWFEKTGDPQAARVLRQTAAFLAREMTSPEGALWSAIDAETNAREGAFYVWTEAEMEHAGLSAEQRAFAAPLLGFADPPDFRDPHGAPEDPPAWVLHLPRPLEDRAAEQGVAVAELLDRLDAIRSELLAARARRPRPLTDDKVMADWNGLGIAGLATAGRVLGDREMIEQARRAATEVVRRLLPTQGPLRHVWRAEGGGARLDAFLADYSYLVHGLLALEQATGEEKWLGLAVRLTEQQIERLWDGEAGGFFAAGPDPDLLGRSKDAGDGARPSGNGMAALNLLELHRRTGERRWLDRAARTLRAFAPQLGRSPAGHMTLARAAARFAAASARAGTSAVGVLDQEARSKVRASARFVDLARGGWRTVRVELSVAEGWHINANPASDEFLVATELKAVARELRRVSYPPARRLETTWSAAAVEVYDGTVSLEGELAEGAAAAEVHLVFQACDAERCLPTVDTVLTVEP